MSDLLSYEIWHTSEHRECTDTDGQPLLQGWYYTLETDPQPIGPFDSAAKAESEAVIEIEDFTPATRAGLIWVRQRTS